MNKQYEVQWTSQAEYDLEEIIEYIFDTNPQKAGQLLAEIRNKACELSTFPERGRYVPELKSLGITTYRELIYKPWWIIYRIEQNRVFVLAVLDARRNLETLLFERLIR